VRLLDHKEIPFPGDASPLADQLAPVSTRRMRHHDVAGVAQLVAGARRAPAPFHIFGRTDAEASDRVERRAPHEKIAGARKPLLLDVPFEIEREYFLVRLDRGEPLRVFDIDLDPPADNVVGVSHCGEAPFEPVDMRAAVGIDEGERCSARGRRAGVARLSGALNGGRNHHRAIGANALRRLQAAAGVVVGDDNFELIA
jgi:hypothetical protein